MKTAFQILLTSFLDGQLVCVACLCLLVSSFFFLRLKCTREQEQVCVDCMCPPGSVCVCV